MAFSLQAYIEANFDVKTSGEFIYFRCVFCDKPWKLWVNVGKNPPDGWCFRCHTWTDAVKLVMAHRGMERFAALEFMKKGEYAESLATALQRAEPRRVIKVASQILPESYEPIGTDPSDLNERMAVKYLKGRGLTDLQIQEHAIGYASTGKYYGCIIVPVKKGGKVAYFVARAYLRSDVRYLNPSKAEIGTGKSEVVFNYDRASRFDEAFVCEGVFDALAMGERGMAIFGSDVSDEQMSMLLKFKKLGVCLDPDAETEQNELVEKLFGFGIDAYPLKALGKDVSESGGKVERGERSFLSLMRTRMGQ